MFHDKLETPDRLSTATHYRKSYTLRASREGHEPFGIFGRIAWAQTVSKALGSQASQSVSGNDEDGTHLGPPMSLT